MKKLILILTVIVSILLLTYLFLDSKQKISDVEFFKNKAIFNASLNEEYTLDLIYFSKKNINDLFQNKSVIVSFEDNNFISVLDYDVIKGDKTNDYQLTTLSLKVRFNEIGRIKTSNLKLNYNDQELNYPIGDYEFITHQTSNNDYIRVGNQFPIITSGINYRASLENFSNERILVERISFNDELDQIQWNAHLDPNEEINGAFELDTSLIHSEYDFLIIRPLVEFSIDHTPYVFIPYATYYNYLSINDEIIEAQKDK